MKGLSRFYTGRACRSGHFSERYVSNGQCVACNAAKAQDRERSRSSTDPAYRVYRNVQRRTGQALAGLAGPVRSMGCTLAELRQHLERLFRPGMVWGNYRQWEVDHVVPLSAARDHHHLIELCHFTNLQPLWKRENLVKGGA